MSIDEPRNPKHAAMVEEDHHPGWNAIPERTAADRIASLLGRYLDPRWLTEACLREIAAKVIANRAAIAAVFDELDADPARLGERGTVLRRQQTAQTDSLDWWLEQAAYHKHAWEEAVAHLTAQGANPKDYDAQERGEDEDDARISRERRDEQAANNAPRVA